MLDVLRFWLDRGVDGFRVDVLWLLIKDDQFRDNPPNPAWQPHQAGIDRCLQRYSADRPEIHEVVGEMRAVLDAYPDRVLIGEIYLPLERLVAYYGSDMKGAQLAIQLPADLHRLDRRATYRPDRGRLRRRRAGRRLAELGTGQPRSEAHRDPTRCRRRSPRRDAAADAARHADVILRRRTGAGECRDPARPRAGSLGKKRTGLGPAGAIRRARRCHGTTRQMPASPPARRGCRSTPTMRTRNVAALTADPRSILSLYRRLIALRREHAALRVGRFMPLACRPVTCSPLSEVITIRVCWWS